MAKHMKPIHPGEVLRAEFLEPLGVSQYRVAKERATHHAAAMSCPVVSRGRSKNA